MIILMFFILLEFQDSTPTSKIYIFHENILLSTSKTTFIATSTSHTPILGSCIWTYYAVSSPFQCSIFSAFKQKEHSSKPDNTSSVFTVNHTSFSGFYNTSKSKQQRTSRSTDPATSLRSGSWLVPVSAYRSQLASEAAHRSIFKTSIARLSIDHHKMVNSKNTCIE